MIRGIIETKPVLVYHHIYQWIPFQFQEIQHTDSPASTSQEVNNASQPSTSQDLDRLDLENDKVIIMILSKRCEPACSFAIATSAKYC